MPIEAPTLLNNFQREMDSDTAAFFLGAGMSRPSGFVLWKELMREIADELKLDVSKETDLIALAQWHQNTRKNRHKINQTLVEEFTKEAKLTDNHRLIASLPVSTIWTTNYDHLVETAYAEGHKRLEVKKRQEDLTVTKPRCHATLFKMHGDVDAPDEAVLTKEDYATFQDKRGLFTVQLRGHLVSKSFLFLGYSFADPNMDYILARIRAALGNNKREHYCVMRRVIKEDGMTDADFDYQTRLLTLRIDDLQNYGIQTLIIDDYSEITKLLRELSRRAVRKNVFVSGSAHDFLPLGQDRLETFSRTLGSEIIKQGFNLVSGIGLGIGGAVTVGALETLYGSSVPQIDDRVTLRPFPQVAPAAGSLAGLWDTYRREMIGKVCFAVFLAGNKLDKQTGSVVDAGGVRKEFDIAVSQGVFPIPVGATGHVAKQLHGEVVANLTKYYGPHAAAVKAAIETLGDEQAGEAKWLGSVFSILKVIAPK